MQPVGRIGEAWDAVGVLDRPQHADVVDGGGVLERMGGKCRVLTTIVGMWPPPVVPLMPVVSLSDSSHSMMILPPAVYQLVACTCGIKVARKVSPSCTVPRSSSSIWLGVYHTKSGALALFRSGSNWLESASVILALGKNGQGKCRMV